MAQPSHLIVGLGNPEAEYRLNRHNVGFMAAEVLAESAKATSWQKKFKGEIATGTIAGETCAFLKPKTFMNLSGESVGEALRFYKLTPNDVIVLHDDLDLLPGKIKAKQGGGSGGHNGLKSIDAHIGAEYWRVRIGIGHPGDRAQVTNYVLGNFSKADKAWLDPLLERLVDAFPLMTKKDIAAFVKKVTE